MLNLHDFLKFYRLACTLSIFTFTLPLSALYGVNVGAGFGLWQEQTRYINTIDVSFRQDFTRISYEIELSIFIPFDRDSFIFAAPNEEDSPLFVSLANLDRIFNFFKEVSYHDKHIQAGLANKKVAFQNTLIWGNPFFNQKIPFLGPNFYIETRTLNFYTSMLPDPSLMLINSEYQPFAESKHLLLKTLQIEPSAYIDWRIQQNRLFRWGVGFDLTTIYWQHKNHSLGLQGGFSYSAQLLRSTFFSFYKFKKVTIGLGGIVQDENHPTSPSLSPLYVNQRENNTMVQSNNRYSPGGSLFIKWKENELHSFAIYLDLYSKNEPIFSYRVYYYLRFEDFFWGISHIRDSVISLRSFANFKAPTSFFGFDLKAKVIHNLFEIGWSSYLAGSDTSRLRSRLYVHLIF